MLSLWMRRWRHVRDVVRARLVGKVLDIPGLSMLSRRGRLTIWQLDGEGDGEREMVRVWTRCGLAPPLLTLISFKVIYPIWAVGGADHLTGSSFRGATERMEQLEQTGAAAAAARYLYKPLSLSG